MKVWEVVKWVMSRAASSGWRIRSRRRRIRRRRRRIGIEIEIEISGCGVRECGARRGFEELMKIKETCLLLLLMMKIVILILVLVMAMVKVWIWVNPSRGSHERQTRVLSFVEFLRVTNY